MRILILTCIISFPLLLNAQHPQPVVIIAPYPEKWDVYIAKYEKGPGSTMLNMALKGYAPIKGLPFVVVTGVKFKDCTTGGFPTEKEFLNLYRVSDSVEKIVKSLTKNNLAGTFTHQCERLDYYYVADTNRLREKINNMYSTGFKSYESYTNIKEDKEWKFYREFLYPNEETRESMLNQKVIIKLQEAGDKLEKEREVEHWLRFRSERDRNCFAAYIAQHSFKVVPPSRSVIEKKRNFNLNISRTDKVDLASMNKLTLELRREVQKCNGEYDGWETIVIK